MSLSATKSVYYFGECNMIQEALLILGCLNSACEPTRYTYMNYNPEVKQAVQKTETRLKNFLPGIEQYAPIIAAGVRQEVKLPITKNISISYKNETVSTKLVYGVNF